MDSITEANNFLMISLKFKNETLLQFNSKNLM